jgi:hypothetical protein
VADDGFRSSPIYGAWQDADRFPAPATGNYQPKDALKNSIYVVPAQAGAQANQKRLDARLRGHDG